MPTPCIPPLYYSDSGEVIPAWHEPDPTTHVEILMDDPPDVPAGYRAILAEQPDEQHILRYHLEPIPLDELRDARLAELAAIRYAHEIAGTAYNGWPVDTSRDSQGKATALYAMAQSGLWRDGQVWKFSDGMARPLTVAQAAELAQAIAAHVQSCFEREAALAAQIRSSDAPLGIDLDGWP